MKTMIIEIVKNISNTEYIILIIILIYIFFTGRNKFSHFYKLSTGVYNTLENPKDANAWCDRGKAQYFLKLYNRAIYSLNNAIELNNNNFFAWCYKGRALYKLKKYNESIQAFDKAIEIKPEDYSLWNFKGEALYNLEKFDEAICAYEKAIEINPESSHAWYNKGKVLYELEKFEDAIIAYNKTFEIDPDYSSVWYENKIGANILNLLPFKCCRKKYNNIWQKLLKEKMEYFGGLNSISAEEKDRIRPIVLMAACNISGYEITNKLLISKKIETVIIWTSMLVLMISIIFSWFFLFQSNRSVSEYIIGALFSFFIFLFLVEITFSILDMSYSLLIIFLVSISYIFIIQEFEGIPHIVHDAIGAGIVGLISFVIWMLLFVYVLVLVTKLINRSMNRHYPEAVVLNSICNVLYNVETESDKWNNVKFKRKLLIEIESVAKRFENELSNRISCFDSATNIWLKDSGRKIGTGIRELKKYILLPNDKTREQLITILSTNLVNAADGNWDLFKKIDPPAILSWRLRSFQLLRRLMAIILPMIIVFIILISPIKLSDTIMGYILAGSIGWVAIIILAWLDPDYQEKIGNFTEKADIIPHKRKK